MRKEATNHHDRGALTEHKQPGSNAIYDVAE